jgi:uncharacterized C2H2 Zn-finger protein
VEETGEEGAEMDVTTYSVTTLTCWQCGRSYKRKKWFEKHLNKHSDGGKFSEGGELLAYHKFDKPIEETIMKDGDEVVVSFTLTAEKE